MLKLRLAPFAAIGLSAAIAVAQDSATTAPSKTAATKVKAVAAETVPAKRAPVPVRRAIVKATPIPVATPVPKKPGFWERVFGKKKATPAPATPTPATVIKKKIAPKPRSKKPKPVITGDSGATTRSEKVANVEPARTGDESTPPAGNDEKPKPSTPKTGKGKNTAQRSQDFPPATDNADAEIVEKQKYDQAKAKAVADPKVQELRGKADLAPSEDESRKALREYNKAMFRRMKEIDPSIKDHINRMEAAVMSRLGGE